MFGDAEELAQKLIDIGLFQEQDVYNQVGQSSAELGRQVQENYWKGRKKREAQRKVNSAKRKQQNARIADASTNTVDEANIYSTPTADIDSDDIVDRLNDIALTGMKSATTAGKSAIGIGNIVSAGALDDTYNKISEGEKALDEMYASDQLRQQMQNIANVSKDPNAGIGDMAMAYIENPYASALEIARNTSTALLPGGAGGLVGRIAQLGKLAKYAPQFAKGTAMVIEAAMNAGDNFSDKNLQNLDLADRYKVGGLSFGTSLATSGLMDGGLAGKFARRFSNAPIGDDLLRRQLSMSQLDNAVKTAWDAGKSIVGQGVTEVGQDSGGVLGKAWVEGRPLNIGDAKELTSSFMLGMGSGTAGATMDVNQGIGNANAISERDAIANSLTDILPQLSPQQQAEVETRMNGGNPNNYAEIQRRAEQIASERTAGQRPTRQQVQEMVVNNMVNEANGTTARNAQAFAEQEAEIAQNIAEQEEYDPQQAQQEAEDHVNLLADVISRTEELNAQNQELARQNQQQTQLHQEQLEEQQARYETEIAQQQEQHQAEQEQTAQTVQQTLQAQQAQHEQEMQNVVQQAQEIVAATQQTEEPAQQARETDSNTQKDFTYQKMTQHGIMVQTHRAGPVSAYQDITNVAREDFNGRYVGKKDGAGGWVFDNQEDANGFQEWLEDYAGQHETMMNQRWGEQSVLARARGMTPQSLQQQQVEQQPDSAATSTKEKQQPVQAQQEQQTEEQPANEAVVNQNQQNLVDKETSQSEMQNNEEQFELKADNDETNFYVDAPKTKSKKQIVDESADYDEFTPNITEDEGEYTYSYRNNDVDANGNPDIKVRLEKYSNHKARNLILLAKKNNGEYSFYKDDEGNVIGDGAFHFKNEEDAKAFQETIEKTEAGRRQYLADRGKEIIRPATPEQKQQARQERADRETTYQKKKHANEQRQANYAEAKRLKEEQTKRAKEDRAKKHEDVYDKLVTDGHIGGALVMLEIISQMEKGNSILSRIKSWEDMAAMQRIVRDWQDGTFPTAKENPSEYFMLRRLGINNAEQLTQAKQAWNEVTARAGRTSQYDKLVPTSLFDLEEQNNEQKQQETNESKSEITNTENQNGSQEDEQNERKRIEDWISDSSVKKAEGKTIEQLRQEFGTEQEPIAHISEKFKSVIGVDDFNDVRVYSSKAYFLDHLNKHKTQFPIDSYKNIQEILNDPDLICRYNTGANSYTFVKKMGRRHAIFGVHIANKNGQIIVMMTFYKTSRKKAPTFAGALYDKSSVDAPSHNQAGISAPAVERLSGLDDSNSLNKSTASVNNSVANKTVQNSIEQEQTNTQQQKKKGDASWQNADENAQPRSETKTEEKKAQPEEPKQTPSGQSEQGSEESAFNFSNSRWDNLIRTIQDHLVDLKRIQEQLVGQGGTIDDNSNPYREHEAYGAKLQQAKRKYVKDYVKPLVTEIKKAGLNYNQVSRMLYESVVEGKKTSLPKSIQKIAENIERDFANMMRDEGLITKKEHDLMMVNGALFEYVARMDNKLNASNYLASLLAFGDSVLQQKAKNEVGRALLNMCRNNQSDAWNIKAQKIEIISQDGVRVANVPSTSGYTIAIRDTDGTLYHIEPNADNAVTVNAFQNLKNMDAQQADKVLDFFNKLNGYFGKWVTSRNPAFVIRNLFRDTQDALFNLSNTPINEAKHRVQLIKNMPQAMMALKNVLQDNTENSAMGKYAKEFIENGGRTSFLDGILDQGKSWSERIDKELTRLDKDGKEKLGMATIIAEGMERANTIAENAVRLSAYAVARENGSSIKEAISIARNITVNFSRHGTSRVLSSLYLFGNASVQGTARLLKAVNTKQGKILAGAIVGMGFVNRLIVQMMYGAVNNDDWRKATRISQAERDNYIIIPVGFDDYWKIPLPHGVKAFFNIGGVASDLMFSEDARKYWGSYLLNELTSMATSFMPTGSNSVADMLTPTVARPIAQIATNTNSAGNPITEEVSGDTPRYKADDFALPPHYKALAKVLSKITGEDDEGKHAGWLNVYPRHIMNAVDGYFAPGLSLEVEKTLSMVEKLVMRTMDEPSSFKEQKQSEIRAKDLPFVGWAFGSPIKPWETRRIKPGDKGWTQDGRFLDKNSMDALKGANGNVKRMDVSDVKSLTGESYGHSYNGTAKPLVIKTIDSAEKSIDISAYALTDEEVVNHLIASKNRDVEIRIVSDAKMATNKSMAAALQKLEDNGIEYRTTNGFNSMHDKFMVVDGKHVETGSYNYTRNASDYNSENVTVKWNDKEKASSYARSFENAWTMAKSGQTYTVTEDDKGKKKYESKEPSRKSKYADEIARFKEKNNIKSENQQSSPEPSYRSRRDKYTDEILRFKQKFNIK